MKATSKNIERVFQLLKEQHAGNFQGADFGQFDDESDLLSALESVIEQIKECDD